jgi:hypothetical protein
MSDSMENPPPFPPVTGEYSTPEMTTPEEG